MKRAAVWLLGLALLASLVRLGSFAATVAQTSLQMDLASFYAAGQAVDAGLSPYVNHVGHDPPIWDGVDRYVHSRFLYPPPAARLFQPLAWLPYSFVKGAWILASLMAAFLATWLALDAVGLGRSTIVLLVAGLVVAWFFPLRVLLERGQVDAFTLLLIVAALLVCRGSRSSYGGGILLAVATLVKLHCVFLVPFLLVRRRWRHLAGFGGGVLVLLLLGMAFDGYTGIGDYVAQQLPRIARYGEGGPRTMLLPEHSFGAALRGAEPGRTVMDGRGYRPQIADFVLNASLVRTPLGRATWSAARSAGIPLAPGHVSLVFLFVGCAVVLPAVRGRDRDPVDRVARWQIALIVILLCAPVTWAMNVVWLLPLVAILAARRHCWNDGVHAAGWVACAVGLVLAGVSDGLLGVLGDGVKYRYVAAELLCLAGLLALVRPGRSAPSPGTD